MKSAEPEPDLSDDEAREVLWTDHAERTGGFPSGCTCTAQRADHHYAHCALYEGPSCAEDET